MELQRTFKKQYALQLEQEAKNGIGIERYTKKEFDYDKSQVLIIPTIYRPQGLLEKMDPDDDLITAIALYEAYSDLTPLQAADKSLWAYLAHVDLFNYVQERNPQVFDPGFNDANYINNHFFYGFGHQIYHPLYGLWWGVKNSVDENSKDPYEYTRIFFKEYGLRITYIGRYMSFRHKEEVIGICMFIRDEEELFATSFRQRIRYIAQYLNRLGATKQLISLNREFFYNELTKLKPILSQIFTDADILYHQNGVKSDNA